MQKIKYTRLVSHITYVECVNQPNLRTRNFSKLNAFYFPSYERPVQPFYSPTHIAERTRNRWFCSWLLEKFVTTVCICVLSCMSFSYAHCCCLDVRHISVYVFVYTHSCRSWWHAVTIVRHFSVLVGPL